MVCSDIRFPFSFYMKIELLLSKCKGEPAQSIVTAWRLRKRHEVCYIFHLLPGKPGMPSSGNQSGVIKFADFVVDSHAAELYRRGKKIKLQHQPTQVLLALLEKPGQIVTREELRQRIWSSDTFVDFEHSLNTAIKKLRLALGDSATNSKFVETLPRRGYRFMATVEASEGMPVVKTAAHPLEGKVFTLVAEEGTECVLAPVDGKAQEEWQRLLALNDDVGRLEGIGVLAVARREIDTPKRRPLGATCAQRPATTSATSRIAWRW